MVPPVACTQVVSCTGSFLAGGCSVRAPPHSLSTWHHYASCPLGHPAPLPIGDAFRLSPRSMLCCAVRTPGTKLMSSPRPSTSWRERIALQCNTLFHIRLCDSITIVATCPSSSSVSADLVRLYTMRVRVAHLHTIGPELGSCKVCSPASDTLD